MKDEEQLDLFQSHTIDQARSATLKNDPFPEIENRWTGQRFALLRVKSNCNAPGCENSRGSRERLVCTSCWFDGWVTSTPAKRR